jgi:hypothetical protein
MTDSDIFRILMDRLSVHLKRICIGIISIIIAVVWIYIYTIPTKVNIEIASDVEGIFQIFWKEKGRGYSEKRSVSIPIQSLTQNLSFKIADLRRVDSIRIDPIKRPADITISKIVIKHLWFEPIRINSIDAFRRLKTLNHIGNMMIRSTGINLSAIGIDPQIEVDLEPKPRYAMYGIYVVASFFAYAALNNIFYYVGGLKLLFKEKRQIYACFFVLFMLFLLFKGQAVIHCFRAIWK